MVPPDDGYSFPFTPYSIQLDLMRFLYETLDNSSIAVVESPTGTGKSLSLLCATLTWLQHARSQARQQLILDIRAQFRASDTTKDEPEWVLQHEIDRQLKLLECDQWALEERLEKVRKKEQRENLAGKTKRIKLSHSSASKIDPEDEFAPDPYSSDGEDNSNGTDNYTPAVREMLKKLTGAGSSSTTEVEDPDIQKIFYASRTHSQLSQFVSELRKTPFSLSGLSSTVSVDEQIPPIRVIPLGSRQALCINDDVRKRSGGSNEALGDLCAEMQKGGKTKRCEFLPPISEPAKMNDFKDRALASVKDIEDIEDLGRKIGCCPYYGSRRAVRSAQLVTLPYNMLMQKSAREALGISLKDHIVVIDEAHNLIDALLGLHAISITTATLQSLQTALFTYFTKFKSRLKGSNAAYLKQLVLVLKGLREFGENWAAMGGEGKKEEMLNVNQVVNELKGALDQVNLLKLDAYLQKSQIARKIGGYVDSLAEEATAKGRQAIRSNATRNLHQIQTFLLALTNAEKDGRIILSSEKVALTKPTAPPPTGSTAPTHKTVVTLRYLLLNPSEAFRDVVEDARSVVLAGGTMTPLSDFAEQLFPYLEPNRFATFSCGHIVPPDHVGTYAVSKGPTGVLLEFKYDRRGDEKLIDELGSCIFNICNVVPKGVVVFVPSYAFFDQVLARWSKSGLLARLAKKKQVFSEPRTTGEVESTLRDYSAANSGASNGGVLFAVVGAKLSEGINFSDNLARAVVICGIPYPNAQSTELKERMKYLKSMPRPGKSSSTPDAGQVLYQNLAFRAVNQSIGRAIRHQNDWASIILLDARYAVPSAQTKLPAWLGADVERPASFGSFVGSLSKFVKRRGGDSSSKS